MSHRLERVNIEALRVAAIAVAVVAVVYALIASVIVMYVNNSLVGQVDDRLRVALRHITSSYLTSQVIPVGVQPGARIDPSNSQLGAPIHEWVLRGDGTVTAATETAVALPRSARRVTAPTSLFVAGEEIRLSGAQVGDGYVLVGQSLAGVEQARGTTIRAELIVGVVLLVLVFFGAIAIGRRVGAPFELARQRQLEFTADASHELRTPLSVIEAQTSLALNQERDPTWYRDAFTRVSRETHRMHQLVDDMLWLARADTTEVRTEAEPVDLGVLIRQTVDRFTTIAEARGAALTLTVAGGNQVVMGSATWLDRLAGVLIDNALKYAGPGGHVAVTVSSDEGRVRLAVDDS
ncbi:MAG TPA: HAMP domain-containing sensor histidine kinase, partial [Candidatus Dormibacteraeota bacterium]|nr:HAMP domain-containing sensor histidine kinase [Candidatus Dormibacteraeota bacterium]